MPKFETPRKSKDDSNINTSASPSSSFDLGSMPPRIARLSNSDNARNDDLLRESIEGGSGLKQTIGRLSQRYSSQRYSSQGSALKWPSSTIKAVAEEETDHLLDMTQITHIDANTMMGEDCIEKTIAWERLKFFLSTGRDKLAFENLKKELLIDKMRLTRDLRWSQFLILCIEKALAEKNLASEHEVTSDQPIEQRIAREFRWSKILGRVMEKVKSGMARETVRGLIETETTIECAVFEQFASQAYTSDRMDQFKTGMALYFRFRSVEMNLTDSLAEKEAHELTELSTRYCANEVAENDFHSVDMRRYVLHELAEMREFCHQDIKYSATAEGISPEKAERDFTNIKEHLNLQIESENLTTELQHNTVEELRDCYETAKTKKNAIEDERTSLDEEAAYYEELAQKTQQALIKHPIIRKKHADLLSPDIRGESLSSVKKKLGQDAYREYVEQLRKRITHLVDQPVDLLLEMNGENILEKAISSKNLLFIAKVLAYAKHRDILPELLKATILKLKKEELTLLIGGAHLFDPERGGLYNPILVKEIRSIKKQCDSGSDFVELYCDSFAIQDERLNFFDQNDRPILSDVEQAKLNKQVLEAADDRALVAFIEQMGSGKCHRLQASEIRADLIRRYITNKESVPDNVRAVLNKNLAIAERGERLATFYDKQTRHVCVAYSKDPELYAYKANLILEKFKGSAKGLNELESEAIDIANVFVDSRSNLGRRQPGCIPDPHLINKTQRMFASAKSTLVPSGVLGSIGRGFDKFIQVLSGSDRQNDASVLKAPIILFAQKLTQEDEKLLDKIPLTPQEKDACVKRAVLARGVFKSTLEYLESRKNSNKLEAVEKPIQDYVNGKSTATELIAALKAARDTTLTLKSQAWFGLWAKSERLINQDLANENAFIELHQKTVAAVG